MPVTIKIECDGIGCDDERELKSISTYAIGLVKYHTYGQNYYCQSCWPKVKNNIKEKTPDWVNY